jgi:hypothetical protein
MKGYQQELFSEADNAKKVKKRIFKKHLFDKNNVRFSLTYEQLGLFVILFIVLLSVVFTLGVERGKRIDFNVNLSNKAIDSKEYDHIKENILNEKKDIPDKEEQPKSVIPEEYFTIQVVTYKKDSLVKSELEYLKKRGYTSFVIESGKFKHICVGKFEDKKEYREIFRRLRKRYKDCFVKKIK